LKRLAVPLEPRVKVWLLWTVVRSSPRPLRNSNYKTRLLVGLVVSLSNVAIAAIYKVIFDFTFSTISCSCSGTMLLFTICQIYGFRFRLFCQERWHRMLAQYV
jgi:hypothetical protein